MTAQDYGLNCVKCGAHQFVFERNLLGVVLWRNAHELEERASYEKIFGHRCAHDLRRGGFGRYNTFLFRTRGVVCGIYGEWASLQYRVGAVLQTLRAFERLGDLERARTSFVLIEQLCPERWTYRELEQHRDRRWGALYEFTKALEKAESLSDWDNALNTLREQANNSTLTNPV